MLVRCSSYPPVCRKVSRGAQRGVALYPLTPSPADPAQRGKIWRIFSRRTLSPALPARDRRRLPLGVRGSFPAVACPNLARCEMCFTGAGQGAQPLSFGSAAHAPNARPTGASCRASWLVEILKNAVQNAKKPGRVSVRYILAVLVLVLLDVGGAAAAAPRAAYPFFVNIVHCQCGRAWRFRASPRGHIVYYRGWFGVWRLWRGSPWTSTLTKFRCRCGRNLRTE